MSRGILGFCVILRWVYPKVWHHGCISSFDAGFIRSLLALASMPNVLDSLLSPFLSFFSDGLTNVRTFQLCPRLGQCDVRIRLM